MGTAAALPYNLGAAGRDMSEKPNIVLIMADDVGCEPIGAYGGVSESHFPIQGIRSVLYE